MIRIYNPGHLDQAGITTFGISAKETDSPIGYFGTGLKYAIAVTLRLGGEVSILNNDELIEFVTAKEQFRNKDFEFIDMVTTVDGEESRIRLPFTTELGKNWEPWQALREFICNAIDENGCVLDEYQATPAEGVVFKLTLDEYEVLAANRFRDIFLDTGNANPRRLASIDIYDKPSHHIYYRGVRVMDLETPSKHTYNFINGLTLTEDRTVRDPSRVASLVCESYCTSGNADDAKFLCSVSDAYWEDEFDYSSFWMYTDSFVEGVRAFRRNGGIIPKSLFHALLKILVADVRTDVAALDDHERSMLDFAVDTLNKAGFPITAPIYCVETLGAMTMGQVFDEGIYLSKLAFSMGTRQLMGTIFEEQLHIREKVYDCTRNMQNILIDKLMGEYARKVGVLL